MGQSEYPSKVSSNSIDASLYSNTKKRFKIQLSAYKEEIRQCGGVENISEESVEYHLSKLVGIFTHLREFCDKKRAKNLFHKIMEDAQQEAASYIDDNMAGVGYLIKEYNENRQFDNTYPTWLKTTPGWGGMNIN